MYPEAIASFQRAIELSDGAPSNIAALGYTYGAMGDRARAREQIVQLRRLSERRFVPAYYLAMVHLGMGEKDEALEWLEKAYAERAGDLMELKTDPMYDPLRGDPRFTRFLQRVDRSASSGS